MENKKTAAGKWVYYRRMDKNTKFEKVMQWIGLIIIIAVGIYAFFNLHQIWSK